MATLTKTRELEELKAGYIECLMRSSTDDKGRPLEQHYSADDFAQETIDQIDADCAEFHGNYRHHIDGGCLSHSNEYTDWELAGQDFWLTRSGKGDGYRDTNRWAKLESRRLKEASRSFGLVFICVGNDGKLYF